MIQKSVHSQRPNKRRWLFYGLVALAIGSFILAILGRSQPVKGAEAPFAERTYPLPSRLEAVLQPQQNGAENYFKQISPSSQGYLLWTTWPVQIYLEPSSAPANTARAERQTRWQEQAKGAIADWSRYLPLEITDDEAQANIVILKKQPPLRWHNGQLARARHAETRFRITRRRGAQGQACLSHRQTVYVGDRQGPQQLRGTLRHELGHALGLWGHSPNPGDVLYAGQIADPPEISQSDLNTLIKLYQQPTRLGCLGGLSETAHGS